ncbi:MAG: ATP-binding protein [Cyanobacteria bacterium P01_H01_bin.74]
MPQHETLNSMTPLFQDQPMLMTLLRQFQDGILVCDSAGIVVEFNQALKELLKLNSAVLGKHAAQCIVQDDFPVLLDMALSTGEFFEKEISLKLEKPAIKKLYLEVRFIPLSLPKHTETATDQAAGKRADACIIIFHDVTVIRVTEKMRRDFVANVSHELRTPLSAIEGYAETLLEGALDDDAVRHDFVKVIHRHAIRLTHLVSDLLDLSKLESPDYIPILSPSSLVDLVESQIKELAQEKAKEKEIALRFHFEDPLPMVMADNSSLQQVITNLIDNAIKYTPKKGQVTLKARVIEQAVSKSSKPQKQSNQPKVKKMIQVDVIDNGIGIESKYFSRLFERFYRVDKARSREMGGTGLGLSIVKHIVQLHEGEIWVNSKVNQGSTFSFTLQVAS